MTRARVQVLGCQRYVPRTAQADIGAMALSGMGVQLSSPHALPVTYRPRGLHPRFLFQVLNVQGLQPIVIPCHIPLDLLLHVFRLRLLGLNTRY